jgi:hypothetical protein
MFLDVAGVAIAVRTTARISAVLLVANLIFTARRLSTITPAGPDVQETSTRLVPPSTPRPRRLVSRGRRPDIATFAAFLVSHTIHFASVALLALATHGDSMRNSGGWTAAMVVATLFYLGGWGVLRAKQRPTHGWASTRQRRRETSVLAIVWTVFFLAFLGRSTRSLLLFSLTFALLVSVALFAVASVRAKIALANSARPQSV